MEPESGSFPFPVSDRAQESAREAAARPLQVSELTARIKGLLEGEFRDVLVEGEISNWRPGPSGHVYFALKDADAVLSCVIWRTTAQRIFGGRAGLATDSLTDGRLVEAAGRLSVYEPRGTYQLIVERLRPAGMGDLYRRFLELKERLQKEGLFEPERKRSLPVFPRRIGVVTSPRGAAMRDILNVLRRRFPGLEVILQPTRVQGAGAAREIADALRSLASLRGAQAVDVIVLARGGGSLEDLWAFNEEAVARAVAALPIPVISGVGHETDTTIADLVADRRAPTPSAAAELAVTSLVEWSQRLRSVSTSLVKIMRAHLDARRLQLHRLVAHPAFEEPRTRINRWRQRLDDLTLRLERRALAELDARRRRLQPLAQSLAPALERRLSIERRRLDLTADRVAPSALRYLAGRRHKAERLDDRLESLNPRRVLDRGYAIVTRQEGARERIISDARLAPHGKKLRIEFANGRIGAISEGPEDQGFQLGLEFDENQPGQREKRPSD